MRLCGKAGRHVKDSALFDLRAGFQRTAGNLLGFLESLAEWMGQKSPLFIYHSICLPKKFKVHELRK